MRAFLTEHLAHVVALATLVSRLGDIGTTFLVSPTLRLEANPIARRLSWKYTFATLGLALLPYYSIHGGIVVFTASFLVSALNASEAMLARFMGEEQYSALHRKAIQRMPVLRGLSLLCLPALPLMMLAGMMFILFPASGNRWGFDIAMGTMVCAVALMILYPIRFVSERRLLGGEPGGSRSAP